MIDSHVLVLQLLLVPVSLGDVRPDLRHLLPERVDLHALLHDRLPQLVLVALLRRVQVVETLLQATDLVLQRSKVTLTLTMLLNLQHHVLKLTVIHF